MVGLGKPQDNTHLKNVCYQMNALNRLPTSGLFLLKICKRHKIKFSIFILGYRSQEFLLLIVFSSISTYAIHYQSCT